MKKFFNKLQIFLIDTAKDSRIPLKDKKLLTAILVILCLRILFIPDWIPFFGILDVLFLLGIFLDYFFGVTDQSLLLSHYPWGMKSFARIKRISQFLAFFSPAFIKDNIWQYTKDPFR